MIIVLIVAVMISFFAVFLYRNGNLGFIHPLKKATDNQIKIACVGDSITYGSGIKGWPKNSYPYKLNSLLGQKYLVNNFGHSGRTAMYDGDYPYTADKLYRKSLEYNPDIVIIMFGTNDSKPYNWKGKEAFITDYGKLIDSYLALESAPEIYIISPPPAFKVDGIVKFDIDDVLISTEIYLAVGEIATSKGLHYIDMYEVFKDKPQMFPDGIHLDRKGAELFAKFVYDYMMQSYETNN